MGVVISSSFLRSSTVLPLIVSHLRIFYLEAYRRIPQGTRCRAGPRRTRADHRNTGPGLDCRGRPLRQGVGQTHWPAATDRRLLPGTDTAGNCNIDRATLYRGTLCACKELTNDGPTDGTRPCDPTASFTGVLPWLPAQNDVLCA